MRYYVPKSVFFRLQEAAKAVLFQIRQMMVTLLLVYYYIRWYHFVKRRVDVVRVSWTYLPWRSSWISASLHILLLFSVTHPPLPFPSQLQPWLMYLTINSSSIMLAFVTKLLLSPVRISSNVFEWIITWFSTMALYGCSYQFLSAYYAIPYCGCRWLGAANGIGRETAKRFASYGQVGFSHSYLIHVF
jgi:hypothetical protein